MSQRIIDEQGRTIEPDTGEVLSEDFQILDVYAEDGEAKPRRADWLGTISAGFKNAKGYPEASHDGTIHFSGDRDRCAGLIAAMAKSQNKRLTVAFLSDDLNDFIFQRYTRRSASSLEVYGDRYTLTEIVKIGQEPILDRTGKQRIDAETKQPMVRDIYEHHDHMAGTQRYKELRKTCKVEVSVLFALAEWDGQRTAVTFPDGLGAYRIRFTSRNSLQALVGKIEEIKARITRGRIAGVPFDLFLVNRDVPSPTGQVRNVPVWTIEFRPPEAIRLTSGNISSLLGGAIREGQRLQVMLPAPRYGIEDALAEDADVDLEEPPANAAEILTNGDPPCNARSSEASFFSAVRGTALDSDEARRAFLLAYTDDECGSLKDLLADARESQASALLAEVDRLVDAERTAKRRAALEVDGFTDPRGAVIEHEPEDEPDVELFDDVEAEMAAEAPARGTPAQKTARRREMESRMKAYQSAGAALGMDLAPYEFDDTTGDGVLEARGVKLAAAIRTLTGAPEPVAK